MDTTLLIVESPAKAKTIKKYLGRGYEVKASVGHVKDLPNKVERSTSGKFTTTSRFGTVLGVDVENGFVPHYEIIPGKEKIIKELKEAAEKAERVFLATDPDREGEAIAWHLNEELRKPANSTYRVLFNELTEKRIKEAIASPSRLDENKYNAQQARRILDRIVGYQLSPLLWEKVQYGLSAGRVQSVALRLIVDRQNVVDTFVPQEYWSITASLESAEPPIFEAKLVEDSGKKVEITDATTARSLTNRAKDHNFLVIEVKKRERIKRPSPPFITSTLQQEASRRLRFSSTRTMRIAQQLYEGVEIGSEGSVGLITYMRTDSPRIAPEALQALRSYIQNQYGRAYLPEKSHVYKGRKTAQEAHEAIRPTSMEHSPEEAARYLDKAQAALYKLIWDRFVASQMASATFDMTTANIESGALLFRASGTIMKFDGFTRIYGGMKDDVDIKEREKEDVDRPLPPLEKGDELILRRLSPHQHFTQPAPFFNEASLIKELEEQGIGRPSTYAETVTTIQRRKYVEIKDKRFKPTLLGRIISGLLVDSFPSLLNARFTADMESSLDLIEEGKVSWKDILKNFYRPFQIDLDNAKRAMKSIKKEGINTGEACPQCGKALTVRSGRYGLFIGCSSYPQCMYTRKIVEDESPQKDPIPTDRMCECGAPMVIKEGKSGLFLACSRYPECRVALPLTTGVTCPKCRSGELVQRRSRKGRLFYSCARYPDCDYSQWHKPVAMNCPNHQCDSEIMEERFTKKQGLFYQCPKCGQKVIEQKDSCSEQ